MKKLLLSPLLGVFLITANAEVSAQENYDEQMTNGVYYTTSHASAIHNVTKLWEYNEKVELEDGTIWDVKYNDRWMLSNWLTSDVVIILRDNSFFSNFDDYLLVNQRTGNRVRVNLSELEVLPNDATFNGARRWISSIDHYSGLVFLDDGWVWSVYDTSAIQRWNVGDIVTIGINDAGYSSSRPNLIIHFNTLKSVKAIAQIDVN